MVESMRTRSEAKGRSEQQAREAMASREPPHSPELEQAVLAVLLDGRAALAMQQVRPVLAHPLVFFQRDHRMVYQACLDVDDAGHRVDATAVSEHLRQTGFQVALDRLRQQELLLESDQLDQMSPGQRRALYRRRPEDDARDYGDSALAAIGGFAALNELVGAYATAAGLERRAQQLHDYYLKRRLIRCLARLGERAHRTTDAFADLLDAGSQLVLDLSRMGEVGSQVHDVESVVNQTLELIEASREGLTNGVETGYEPLDQCLMSLRPGGLYVLAARPGVGKTSFALSIIQNICSQAEHPRGALLFSLEVDRHDLVKKLLCGYARIDFSRMERGLVDGPELEALADAAEDIKRWKLDLMDASDLTVQALRSLVKRHVLERKGDLGVVVIDYLQLLQSARADFNEYEKISEISRTLKILAKEMKLPVLALSQMSRDSERTVGKPREPRLSDLRGSGSIEQDADAVIFLHRVDENDDDGSVHEGRDVKLIVAKNRFGPQSYMALKFFPARQSFKVVPREEMQRSDQSEVDSRPSRPAAKAARQAQAPSEDEDMFA